MAHETPKRPDYEQQLFDKLQQQHYVPGANLPPVRKSAEWLAEEVGYDTILEGLLKAKEDVELNHAQRGETYTNSDEYYADYEDTMNELHQAIDDRRRQLGLDPPTIQHEP